MEATITVTQEQIDFFRREGYLAIERITTDEEIARMRVAYDDIFARRAGRDEGMEFDLAGTDEEGQEATLPQILDTRRYSAALQDTLYEANARAITRQLLGVEGDIRCSHAILKPAQIGSETPWHQDEAYWNPGENYLSLSVWMPLQEATPENGCMCFIPGSHEWEVKPHHHIGNNPKIHGLEVDEGHVDPAQAVVCPLPAGGATFHYSRTFHYTGPNKSDTPRRAFVLTGGVPLPPRENPRDFYWQQEADTYAAKKRSEAAKKQPEG